MGAFIFFWFNCLTIKFHSAIVVAPALPLLSSLSAPLPSFWSAARVRDSFPGGVTLSCFTASEDTIDMILCPRPPIDPQTYTLWKRVLGPLNAVAACVHSEPKNVLLPSSSEELQRANHLATKAANSQSSSESDLAWPSLPFGTTDLHIRAYFSGSNKGGLGGAGLTIFLDYFGGSSELVSCGFYLGKRIPPNSALLQACGFTLLAVFALLFRLSGNSRLYWHSLGLGKTPFLSARLKSFLPEGLRPLRLLIRSGPKSSPLTTHPECGLCQSKINNNKNKNKNNHEYVYIYIYIQYNLYYILLSNVVVQDAGGRGGAAAKSAPAAKIMMKRKT